jgi:hypothetical protein
MAMTRRGQHYAAASAARFGARDDRLTLDDGDFPEFLQSAADRVVVDPEQ